MTAGQFRIIEELGGVIDLTDRAKFVLSGADRVRFLNGQVTNDVRRISRNAALHACVTNVKGRIESEVFIHANGAGSLIFIDAPAEHRETLAARLEKYIIADDVTLLDVSDEWTMCHVFGAAAESGKIEVFDDKAGDRSRVLTCNRFGAPGRDIWIKAEHLHIGVLAGVEMTTDDAEVWRICRGIPRVPNELNTDAFPQEAGLEDRAMDFAKGCYIGQEILSRIKTTGKMPRRLVRWVLDGSADMVLSRPLVVLVRTPDGELQEAGVVTSAVMHPLLDRATGLAYVRQGLEGADSVLLAAKETPNIAHQATIIRP